jgi:phosphopantothenoylcysteine synthetase/decarboxylase
VTAGNTHEPIDRVREWTNVFSGKTGLDVARALLDVGDVTLLTSNRQHAEEFDGYYGKAGMLGVETFQSHADLAQMLEEQVRMGGIDAVAMSAAVSDYTPAGAYRIVSREAVGAVGGQERWVVESVQAAKVKSTHEEIAIVGRRTLKLVDQFRTAWGFGGVLVKFKLEVGISEEQLITVAEASRVASGADAIVANTLEMVQGPNPGAWILGNGLKERVPRPALAARVRELIVSLMGARK